MNIFCKCLRREFGRQQYRKYLEMCREELQGADILQEQYRIEEKHVFQIMYRQLEGIQPQDLHPKMERLVETLLKAFQIGRQFALAALIYALACILIIALQLDPTVTCVSLALLGICFLYKVYEYISNKVCFMDVYLFMVYKSVLEKIAAMQGQLEE